VAVFCGDLVGGEDLASALGRLPQSPAGAQAETPCERPKTFEEAQRSAIVQALAAAGGKKMEAARLLALDYNRFKRMIDKYRLS